MGGEGGGGRGGVGAREARRVRVPWPPFQARADLGAAAPARRGADTGVAPACAPQGVRAAHGPGGFERRRRAWGARMGKWRDGGVRAGTASGSWAERRGRGARGTGDRSGRGNGGWVGGGVQLLDSWLALALCSRMVAVRCMRASCRESCSAAAAACRAPHRPAAARAAEAARVWGFGGGFGGADECTGAWGGGIHRGLGQEEVCPQSLGSGRRRTLRAGVFEPVQARLPGAHLHLFEIADLVGTFPPGSLRCSRIDGRVS